MVILCMYLITSWSKSLQGKVKYNIPSGSKRFPKVKPVQLITWVTLFAIMNSMS